MSAEEIGSFECPLCGKASRVTDSRPVGSDRRRRRECGNGHRFTTMEMAQSSNVIEIGHLPVHVRNSLRVIVRSFGKTV